MRSKWFSRNTALFILASELYAQKPTAAPACSAVSLDIALQAGGNYAQRVNDLTFKVKTLLPKSGEAGWTFSLEDAEGRDYIYPVNPPLRFNPSQYLGRAYGESARQSLSSTRELRFLLNKADYERFWPLVTNALWPYSAARPDKATEEYFTELGKLRTGLLRLKIVKSDVTSDDMIRSGEFTVEFVAPSDTHFDPQLKPYPEGCPGKIAAP
ncbi:MAG: hypothetical protein DMG22_02310 [Acidobacteria bacterium]|nr:MAG: hypothetical protein DMG22_02310 [Acidobacteriota bacterium]